MVRSSSMNGAEKIAATYLRLNGFLLLPQFTVFNGQRHNHVDLIGVRCAGSIERVGDFVFPTDDVFFDAVAAAGVADPRHQWFGLVAEVKGNDDIERPSEDHIAYVRPFIGNLEIVPVCFSESAGTPELSGDCVSLSASYALNWIYERVKRMDAELNLSKTGSWVLSDDPLSNLLTVGTYLRIF